MLDETARGSAVERSNRGDVLLQLSLRSALVRVHGPLELEERPADG